LNWFHDPTFAGEYRAAQDIGDGLTILEGGVNISPLQRLRAGLADVVVVGIDIALQGMETDLSSGSPTDLRILYADFQRNPVGWIVHPDVAAHLGLADPMNGPGRQRNDWLFRQLSVGAIHMGDKRGTETTAVWASWRQARRLQGVKVTPVGFDPTIVLDAPRLAYPVYMNEEPFKLSEKIGRPVVVFDPADDGVVLYGNVIVTTGPILRSKGPQITQFLSTLSSAWHWVKQNPGSAAALVKRFYPDVSDSVINLQVRRTADFVFFGTETPGVIAGEPGGRLEQTILALQSAGSLGKLVTLAAIRDAIVPVPGGPQ